MFPSVDVWLSGWHNHSVECCRQETLLLTPQHLLGSKDHWLARLPGQRSRLILHKYEVVLFAAHFGGELVRDVLQQRLQLAFQSPQVCANGLLQLRYA